MKSIITVVDMIEIEEKIEDKVKKELDMMNIKYYCKAESVNQEIDKALQTFQSKSGGDGGNYPDIKLLIDDIPVMIEVKGPHFKLLCHHLDMNMYDPEGKNNPLKIAMSQGAVQGFAVNGAIHYCHAILTHSHYDKCIAIGVAGDRLLAFIVTREKCVRLNDVKDLSFLKDIQKSIESKNTKIFQCAR